MLFRTHRSFKLVRYLAGLAAVASAAVFAADQPPASTDPRPPGVIQLMNQLEALNTDLNRLRGQLEVLSNSLENAQRRQKDMYLDLDTRLRRLEQAQGADGSRADKAAAEEAQKHEQQIAELEARLKRLEQALAAPAVARTPSPQPQVAVAQPTAPVPPTVQRPTTPTPPPSGPTPDAETRRAYDSALSAYRGGDFQTAIEAFDAFVKKYPSDPLAANAQYWIGDSWFNLRDFRAAAAAQQTLITKYPESVKAPDAMLNLASAHQALGDNASARRALDELVARYPQTDAAEKARQRLAKLK